MRDTVCAISGAAGLPEDPWFSLIAAHIYPVSQLHIWRDKGHFQWITDTTDPERIGPDRIFSAQNGIFLKVQIHLLFDKFKISVSPDVSTLKQSYASVIGSTNSHSMGIRLYASLLTQNKSLDGPLALRQDHPVTETRLLAMIF